MGLLKRLYVARSDRQTKSHGLPLEYQEVEWLYGGYIVGNVAWNELKEMKIIIKANTKYHIMDTPEGDYHTYPEITIQANGEVTINNGKATKVNFDAVNTVTNDKATLTIRYVLTENPYHFSWCGTSINSWGGPQWYECTITKKDDTIIKLIPCYRKSDAKTGAFDIVNGIFYPAARAFSKGADIIDETV